MKLSRREKAGRTRAWFKPRRGGEKKESSLKKRLQQVDELIGEATRTPAARFVERCGGPQLWNS